MDDDLNSNVSPQAAPARESSTIPWGVGSLVIVSLASLGTATVFIIWRNLIRIKEPKAAELFIIAALIIKVVLGCIAITFGRWGIYGSGLMIGGIGLPIWFYESYLKYWEQKHPGISPKFSWSIIIWGVLGLIFSVVLLLTIDVIIAGILQSNTFNPNQ